MTKWILLVAVALSATNCMKKPDHTPDYGPEVPFSEIQKAANFDMPIAPEKIKKDQRVSIDVYQVLDTQSPYTLWQRSDSVTAYTENKDAQGNVLAYNWTFNVLLRERDEAGQWRVSEQPYGPFCFETVYENGGCPQTQAQSQPVEPANMKPLKAYTLDGMRQANEQKPYKVTYHNLKREDGFMPLPQVVSSRANWCGTETSSPPRPCPTQLRFVRIAFDIVEWTSENQGTKTSARFTYSSDIPTYIYDWADNDSVYFTNMIENCQQTWLKLANGDQTQIVPVRECMEITDFQFGPQ